MRLVRGASKLWKAQPVLPLILSMEARGVGKIFANGGSPKCLFVMMGKGPSRKRRAHRLVRRLAPAGVGG